MDFAIRWAILRMIAVICKYFARAGYIDYSDVQTYHYQKL